MDETTAKSMDVAFDPAAITRGRPARRRVWIAGVLASAAGTCATIAAAMIFMRVGSLWKNWVEIDLGGGNRMVRTPTGIVFYKPPSIWAEIILIAAPIFLFILVAVGVSSLIYRRLRGNPLPKDADNTRCGWCQHALRGISMPVCSECGHRIGDQGSDEQGVLPASRRWARRLAVWIVLPPVFLVAMFASTFAVGFLEKFADYAAVEIGGWLFWVFIFISLFLGLAMTLIVYDAFLRFDLRNCGRAWCRICKGELRDLVEPICPTCGTPI